MSEPNQENRNPRLFELYGLITSMWSEIEFLLMIIFSTITQLDGNRASAIWYTIASERLRQQVLQATAKSIWSQDPDNPGPLFKELVSLLTRVKNNANKRNDLAHAILVYTPGGLAVLTSPKQRNPDDVVPSPKETLVTEKSLEKDLKHLETIRNDLMKFDRRARSYFS